MVSFYLFITTLLLLVVFTIWGRKSAKKGRKHYPHIPTTSGVRKDSAGDRIVTSGQAKNIAHDIVSGLRANAEIIRERKSIPQGNGDKKGFPIGYNLKLIMQIIITIACAGSSLYIILSQNYDPSAEKWAFATIGTIIGFWLNSN